MDTIKIYAIVGVILILGLGYFVYLLYKDVLFLKKEIVNTLDESLEKDIEEYNEDEEEYTDFNEYNEESESETEIEELDWQEELDSHINTITEPQLEEHHLYTIPEISEIPETQEDQEEPKFVELAEDVPVKKGRRKKSE